MTLQFVAIKSVPAVEKELLNYEMRYTDLKRRIAWKKSNMWDVGFCSFIELEMQKIDDTIHSCYQKITEMKFVPEEQEEEREHIWEYVEAYLDELKQLLIKMENNTEKYSEHWDSVE